MTRESRKFLTGRITNGENGAPSTLRPVEWIEFWPNEDGSFTVTREPVDGERTVEVHPGDCICALCAWRR